MEINKKESLFSNKALALIIIPLIIELALNIVVGMVDSIMVSSVGEAAVSGVSLADSFIQLLIYVFAAIASGGAIVAGQYLGGQNREKARQASNDLYWMNLLLSVVILVITAICTELILTRMFGDIDEDVYYHARRYMKVVIFSIPAIAISNAGQSIFRTMGDTRTTMSISLCMNVMNCVGNAILIYYCNMGTAGAALSTVAARWAAAIVITALLHNTKRELHLEKKLFHRFDIEITKKILKMGIPNGIENGIFQLGKIAILSLVTPFGTLAITANAVTQIIASFEMIPGSAVQMAALTVIARCVGTGDNNEVRRNNKKLLGISYATLLVWSLVMVLSLPLILRFYNLSADSAALATKLVICHAIGGVTLWPIAFNLPASLRATGDVRFTMVVSILSMWVFRFGGGWLLAYPLGMGVLGIWISMAFLDWGFRGTIYLVRWKSGKWQKKKVV